LTYEEICARKAKNSVNDAMELIGYLYGQSWGEGLTRLLCFRLHLHRATDISGK